MSKTVFYTDSDKTKLWANPSNEKISKKDLILVDNDTAEETIANFKIPTDEQLATQAQLWAKTELEWIDIQLKYNVSGDTARAKFTDETLYEYAIECRNYVQNVDGVLTIMTDKPSRPQSDIV